MRAEDLTPKYLEANEIAGPRAFALTGRQKALFLALCGKDRRLANIYVGACLVLTQSENPSRLSLAAHAMRELVDKLPIYIDIPQPTKPANLKAKVQELRDSWDKVQIKSGCNTTEGWEGQIDKPLVTFMGKVGSFFVWFAGERATRYERTACVVRALDASENKLPSRIEKLRVDEWNEYHDYFAAVAHQSEPVEFESMVEALEILLLQTLNPQTFDDHADLDALIAEGESNA